MHNSNILFYNQRKKVFIVKNLLNTSMHHVFENEFGLKLEQCKNIPKHPAYTATIPYRTDSNNRIATIWVQKPTLKKLSNILLFEDNPDEDTLEDLTKELANFIVGHAKMLAHNQDLDYDIKTPKFTGIKVLEPKIETLLFKIDNRCIAIQTKDTEEEHG
jgi:hypothetical protein